MHKALNISLLILLLLNISACRSWFEVVSAEQAFVQKEYTTASQLYIKEFEGTNDNLEKGILASRIGDCFRLSNKTESAERWYEKALPFSVNPEDLYKYGLMLKSNGKYKEAHNVFKDYAFNNPIERAKAKKQMHSCDLAMEWVQENQNIEIINLQDINSSASDYAPVWMDGKSLVFTSARQEAKGDKIYGWTGEKHSDIFISNFENNNRLSAPTLLSDTLSTIYNEGTATFTPDFKTMYFTRCGSDQWINDFCNIFVSTQTDDGKWSKPEILMLFDEDSINMGQPFLSPDGMRLYFSANPSDSYGDKDLYEVEKKGDGWSYPKNLGPEINTPNYEGFPSIQPDGRLYFASDGHTGMGGLDILVAERKGKKWVNATNLQHPINSAADDFAIVYEPYVKPEEIDRVEKKGYFSSTRKGGKGNDDLYQFVVTIPQTPEIVETETPTKATNATPEGPIYMLRTNVFTKKLADESNPNSAIVGQNSVQDAIVEILGLDIENTLSARKITDKTGSITQKLAPKSEYKVTVSLSEHFTQSVSFNTNETADKDTIWITKDILLEKIYKQQEIVLDNIYYDLDKAEIREDAKPVLDQLVELLRENPEIQLEFGAHTDSRGSGRYNQNLSQERAESVVSYLVLKKIDARRLNARGYGESELVNDCFDGIDCTEEQHQENRRTTFKVISDKFKSE